MRILIDIGHPAHVHYFKNLIIHLQTKHNLFVTCRDTRIVQQLLTGFEIPFETIGTKQNGLYSKAWQQMMQVRRIRKIISKRKIDIAMGVSATVAHAAKFTHTKSVLFDDDDQAAQPFMAKYVTPFADTVVSPDVLQFERLNNAVYYPGYHELAYLHPNVFHPSPDTLNKYGLSPNDKYFVLRFNAFKAHHDIHEGGLSIQQKRQIVELLKGYGRVFITTEAKLDQEFEEYKLPISPEDIHDFLAFSQMLVSDSQTMSSEAAMLGVPSFRCNTFVGRISYLEEEEKRYGLTFGFRPHQFDWMVYCVKKILRLSNLDSEWTSRRDKMLQDKIDVTSFWVWFIENYPESYKIVREKGFDFTQFKKSIGL